MNERIKQLWLDGAQSLWPRPGKCTAGEYDYNLEAFAKLIVQECVNILEKPEYVMTHPEELTDYNRGWVNGRLLGIEHIKEQFGVE